MVHCPASASFPLRSWMLSISRVLPVAREGFLRRIQTAVSAGDALSVRLLRVPDSGVKAALDSEEVTAIIHGGDCSWESLVFKLGDFSSRKALLVLEWKLEKLLKDDVRTFEQYVKLIQCSCKLNCLSFAMRVFTSIEGHGIRPNTLIFNALVSTCLSVGKVPTALSLFEIMQWGENAKPDLATYNSFISMYSEQGNARGMKGWYLAAKQSGFLPSIQTYELLITGLIRSGNFKDANQLYEEMMASEISPNSQILDSMLEGVCGQKDTGRVRELVEDIMKRNWSLRKPLVEKLINLHLEQGQVEELVALLSVLKPTTASSTEPGVHGSVIRAYALLEKLDDMECWIRWMLNGGMTFTCKEDVEAVITSYFRRKAFRRMDLFLDQIKGSYKLERSTYDILIAGYRKFELYDKLNFVVKDMKRAGYICNVSDGSLTDQFN